MSKRMRAAAATLIAASMGIAAIPGAAMAEDAPAADPAAQADAQAPAERASDPQSDLDQALENQQTAADRVDQTQAYLDLVSADNEHENGFRAYIQCQRIAVGEQIANKFWETINGTPRESNEVHTNTPDMTPSISLEKWDEASGFPEGDRDRSDDALNIQDETTTIVFTITNTSKTDPDTGVGAWFKASDLRIEDSTIVGDGEIVDWQYPENWDSLVLKPGDSVDVKATLKGVTDKHTDRASVSGVPLLPCTPDTDDDPFGTGQCDDDTAGDQTDGDGTGESDGEPVVDDASEMADTGSAVLPAALGAILAAMAGAFLHVRRRRNVGKSGDTSMGTAREE